ncbi:MAG: DinB family protein [Anaerolineae bacterium]|nr:DinB family protein [Anaerolineae bacterium]
MIAYPQADEYGEYYGRYMQRVPTDADLLEILSAQPAELKSLLRNISDAQADVRPAPGEWSIKEVMGHVTDTERIFAYRALCVARAETTPLPGFEQDDYVRATDFNRRTLTDLLEEFSLQRAANMLCFKALSDEELLRRGTASGYPLSTRAALYILAGHVMHHVESLKTSYNVKE